MTKQKPVTFSKKLELTLPPDSIFEYITKENVRINNIERNDTGAVINVSTVIDKQYLGFIIAYPDYDAKTVMVGWSKCNPAEEAFCDYDAATVALERAVNISVINKVNLPKEFLPQWDVFIARCRSYYKQLGERGWGFNFTDQSEVVPCKCNDCGYMFLKPIVCGSNFEELRKNLESKMSPSDVVGKSSDNANTDSSPQQFRFIAHDGAVITSTPLTHDELMKLVHNSKNKKNTNKE